MIRQLGFWLALLFFGTRSVWAFRVSPMIVNFAPSGSGATQNFVLENTGPQKIAIQLEATRRFTDPDGKETRTPTDEFSIYPQQLSLQPGEKRNVRVTWTGNRQPDRELNYRLIVTELPIDLKKPEERAGKPGANLTLLMQYVASVYVTPASVMPHVIVDSFKPLADGKAELVLKNTGLAHRVLKGARVFLKNKTGAKAEVKAELLQGENILAQSSRRFVLEVPQAILRAEKAEPGSTQAELDLN